MERDSAIDAWASFEEQLKSRERLNDLIVVESLSRRAQSPLSRKRFFLWLEIAINFLAVLVLGSFAGDRMGSLAGICAAVLIAALLAFNAVLISIAVGLSRLDFEDSVVSLQARLALLKKRHAGLTAIALSLAPLLWAPLLVVLVAATGVDPVRALGVPYIAANAAFGAIVAAVAVLMARLFGERLRRASLMAGVVDALSGQAYREAADYVDTIARYRKGFD